MLRRLQSSKLLLRASHAAISHKFIKIQRLLLTILKWTLFLSQGRTGESWEPTNKIMLWLPPCNEVSHNFPMTFHFHLPFCYNLNLSFFHLLEEKSERSRTEVHCWPSSRVFVRRYGEAEARTGQVPLDVTVWSRVSTVFDSKTTRAGWGQPAETHPLPVPPGWNLAVLAYIEECTPLERKKTAIQNPVSETLFLDKNWTMDNVQKHNICINVPSSETFWSYLR
jgi:hypothetical protein